MQPPAVALGAVAGLYFKLPVAPYSPSCKEHDMQQLTQKLKDGAICVHEVPVPALGSGTVLVRNLYSLVSAGTEGSTVKAARSSLLEKAKQRPQQVQQVLEVVKSQGPVQAWRAVIKKLDRYSPLRYSA